jgi:hypothetical protein
MDCDPVGVGASGKLTDKRRGEPSANGHGREEEARARQLQRFADACGKLTPLCNAEMPALLVHGSPGFTQEMSASGDLATHYSVSR